MSDENGISIGVDDLRAGVSQFDIFDEDKVLLLKSGAMLSDMQIDAIRQRGRSHVILHRVDVQTIAEGRASGDAASTGDAKKDHAGEKTDKRQQRTSEPYSPERSMRFGKAIAGMVNTLDNLSHRIAEIKSSDINELARIPHDLAALVMEDADQVIATALGDESVSGLSARCSQMCVLSINTGLEMGLSQEDLANLGLAALLHDLGLCFLPESIANPTFSLSDDDAWEYRRHPSIIADALKSLPEIPGPVKLLVRQVHERPDGSGYPDRLRKNRIHPLARILNTVDSYLMLTQAGPGRPPIVPHDAMCFLMLQGKEGMFDPDVLRAFLNQLGLFPIGSGVLLDNGERATVIRRDGPHYAHPIVHLHGASDASTMPLRNSTRSIVTPIPNLVRKEMRVPRELAETLTISMLEPA